ncbi:uncharacterized protein LOC134224524 [Armigeres subalbatus]|uniref:uncharacterized protein LOC134224524 n=1 Tax=Armigeres subalbatus TaxID=124917 RepID=UPI002ECFD78A
MMKWVVTRGRPQTDAHSDNSNMSSNYICNKENYFGKSLDLRTYSLINSSKDVSNTNADKCSQPPDPRCSCLQDLPVNQNCQTPLSSLNPVLNRTKKLRTRRERNKALVKRLSAAVDNNNLSDIIAPTSSRQLLIDPTRDLQVICRNDLAQAAILQSILNSSQQNFNEREIKSPEGASPLLGGESNLYRQRAVRRKHCKPLPPSKVVHHSDLNDSANCLFNSFVFRELAHDVLI